MLKGAPRSQSSAQDVVSRADVLLRVRLSPPSTSAGSRDRADAIGQTLIAFLDPLNEPSLSEALASRGVTAFSMEADAADHARRAWTRCRRWRPSRATRPVLLAANTLPRMFPMLTTAAGTVTPARVVRHRRGRRGPAGDPTAAASRRARGGTTCARPRRSRCRASAPGSWSCRSEASDAEDKGGYAKAQDESFYRRQREVMTKVATSDVVITTAAIPGAIARLVTKEMVAGMAPGSVIVDLAAERAQLRADEGRRDGGVRRRDDLSVPRTCHPRCRTHASQIARRTSRRFLTHPREGQAARRRHG